MNRRFIIYSQVISLLVIFAIARHAAAAKTSSKADAAKNTTAAQAANSSLTAVGLIKMMREKEKSLKSYSFDVHRFDLADKFVLTRNEEGLKSYKAILDKLSFLTRQSSDVSKGAEGYKEGISKVLFIKPYSIQFFMEKSDFVPSFLQKSKIIFRPDINDADIFLKEPYLGMLIRKEITSESASALISNWSYELMELNCALANGGKAKVDGTEIYDGKPAYILDVMLNRGKIPWAVGCGGKDKDVPETAYTQLSREMQMMADRIDFYKKESGRIRYWIDKDSLLIVRKEVTFGSTYAMKYRITDIKLNSIKREDLEMVKKK